MLERAGYALSAIGPAHEGWTFAAELSPGGHVDFRLVCFDDEYLLMTRYSPGPAWRRRDEAPYQAMLNRLEEGLVADPRFRRLRWTSQYGPASDRWIDQFLGGRAGRREYWLSFAVVIGLFGLGSLVPLLGMVASISTFAFILIQARRFRDIGRDGKWSFAMLVGSGILTSVVEPRFGIIATVAIFSAFVLVLAVWLGLVKGDAGENRFGEAQNGWGDIWALSALRRRRPQH